MSDIHVIIDRGGRGEGEREREGGGGGGGVTSAYWPAGSILFLACGSQAIRPECRIVPGRYHDFGIDSIPNTIP